MYLSGELDPARGAAFTAHLQTCASCTAELNQQREIDAHLRAGVLTEDPDPAPLESRIRRHLAADSATRTRLLLLAASLAAVLLVAAFMSRSAPPPARVYKDAAFDHRLEIVNQQPREWFFEETAIESLAESRNIPAAAIRRLARVGYRIEKGKLCLLDGRLFLHLVFTDGSQRYSVYLRERQGEHPPGTPQETVNGKPLYVARSGDDRLAALSSGQLSAFFVAGKSTASALSLARAAAAAL